MATDKPYEYPIDDFLRDLEELLPQDEDSPRSFGKDLSDWRDYFRRTYSPADAMERGAAFGMIFSFLGKHRNEFDTGKLAVTGSGDDLLSDELLRALHALICPFAFGIADEMPTPEQVREYAQKLIDERE